MKTDKKIIINVGRQIGSGGRVIAKMLAEEFGCKFYDKELLNLAAKESGFSEKFFEQNDERKGFLKSLFHVRVPLMGESNFYKDNFSQDSLYKFQSDAIKKVADEGSCVFVGRTADYVLRDYKNTVSVFITANIDQRIQAVCKRHGFDRPRRGNTSTRRRRQGLHITTTTRARPGDTQRAMTCASTPACWDWKAQRNLSQNSLKHALTYENISRHRSRRLYRLQLHQVPVAQEIRQRRH